MLFRFILLCKLLFFVSISNSLLAQEENYRAPSGLNNWYAEAGGPAIFYSINYEKYLYRTNNDQYTWSARVGAAYNPIDFNILNAVFLPHGTFMFPFSTSVLKGEGREKLEFGGGFTMLTTDFRNNEVVPHGVVGLRVMESNRICFRLNYVPFWRNGIVTHWIGISIGKNFSFR